jgi:hypothetical protein
MEASVKGIIIFRLALGAHLEVAHGGLGTIIWHTFNYGEPRATVGAVSKRIAVTAVFTIHQLVKTGLAGSHIRRNELVPTSLSLALPNLEVLVTDGATILSSYVLDVGQWRRLCLEFLLKLLNSLCFAFYLDSDIFRSVVNPSLEIVFDSQSVNEGTEADTLNNAPDTNRSQSERLFCCS